MQNVPATCALVLVTETAPAIGPLCRVVTMAHVNTELHTSQRISDGEKKELVPACFIRAPANQRPNQHLMAR